MQLVRKPQNSLFHWCGDSKVSPSRISQILSSMEDAAISCSRALSKIIDLHKVDALRISSKRFGEARHSKALAMGESVLEFTRRVLPAEHPDIGEGRVWSAAALVPHTHSDALDKRIIYISRRAPPSQVIMNNVAVTVVEVSASLA
jgi:hypothetical protein